jgi:hypothetical protein
VTISSWVPTGWSSKRGGGEGEDLEASVKGLQQQKKTTFVWQTWPFLPYLNWQLIWRKKGRTKSRKVREKERKERERKGERKREKERHEKREREREKKIGKVRQIVRSNTGI